MADKQENKETTTQQKNTIDEHNLDLSLNIRPQKIAQNLKRKAEDNDVDGYRPFKGHNGNFPGKNEGAGGSGSGSDTSSHSSQPSVKLPVSPQELPSSTGIIPKPSKPLCNEKCALDKEPTPTPRSPSPKESKLVIGKPPKPNRQTSQRSVLPQMPSVSTTGNGPNGKSITGFLYKYSKTEVSIICVCHGTSFSPAGFVEHAGGVDVQHPLKHIRVVPFAVN